MSAIKPASASDPDIADVLRERRLRRLWNLGRSRELGRGGVRVGGPPFAAFLAGWLIAASRAPGSWAAAFDPSTWERNDSGQYLRIAHVGYRMSTHCTASTFPSTALPGKRLCGDVTWFAGYPALMRALSLTGMSMAAAGLIIAWLCWYPVLLVVWLLSRPEVDGPGATAKRWMCLLLAAVFPGQIYFAALFPISLVTLGMLAGVYFATRRRRKWHALAAGVAAGGAYLASVALLPGLALAYGVRSFRRYRTSIGFAAAGVCMGVLAVLAYAQWSVGHWDAYFMTERIEYRVGLHDPLPALATRFHQLTRLGSAGTARTLAEQTAVVWLVLALAIVGFALSCGKPWRRSPASSDVVLLAAGLTGWLIPYVAGGALSPYRAESLVIVAVPLLRRAPLAVVTPLAVVSASVAWQMAPLFFSRALV